MRAPEISVERVTADLALRQLQAENRRLQAQLTRFQSVAPIVVEQRSIDDPAANALSKPHDTTLLNDLPRDGSDRAGTGQDQ